MIYREASRFLLPNANKETENRQTLFHHSPVFDVGKVIEIFRMKIKHYCFETIAWTAPQSWLSLVIKEEV